MKLLFVLGVVVITFNPSRQRLADISESQPARATVTPCLFFYVFVICKVDANCFYHKLYYLFVEI